MQVYNTTPTLYKRDSSGRIRIWFAEAGTDGTNCAWRAVSGLIDGKHTKSGWKSVEQKNIGKVNETSVEQQAVAEMTASFNLRLQDGYFKSVNEIKTTTKVSPMLASKHEDSTYNFNTTKYFSQPKLDGIRCVAKSDGLFTRAGKPIVSVPHIMDQLKSFFDENPDVILDGELYNHDLRDDFNKITSLVRKTKPTQSDIEESATMVQYHVYDVISSPHPFENRINYIWSNFDNGNSIVPVTTDTISNQQQMDDLYGSYLEDGFEGQMIRTNDLYEFKRSKSLIKRKEFLDAEFDVVSMDEGKGNWSGMTKHFTLKLDNTRNFGAGVRGKQEVLRDLWNSQKTPNWVTLRYFTPTPDGIPRFPVVVDWGYGSRND